MGSWIDNKIVVYIGRFTFGLGGENLAVACNTYASSWFKGQALNMAFGFQLAVVRVGSAVSIMILGPIYEAFLPKECALNLTSTTAVTEVTTQMFTTHPVLFDTSPNLTTSIMTTLSTQSDMNCEEEENKAIGMALAVASSSVILSLFGSFVAALLDKRRSSVLGHHLEEQPKVDYKYNFSARTKKT